MFVTCLDFTQTYLYIKVLYWTYFCRFLEDLWDFIIDKKPSFLILKNCFPASADRPSQLTDVHKRARLVWLEGRSTDPVDRQRVLLSGNSPGQPGGRPAESSALCIQATVDRVGRPLAQWSEIWPLVSRPGGRSIAVWTADWTPTTNFFLAYKMGVPWTVFYKIWSEFWS